MNPSRSKRSRSAASISRARRRRRAAASRPAATTRAVCRPCSLSHRLPITGLRAKNFSCVRIWASQNGMNKARRTSDGMASLHPKPRPSCPCACAWAIRGASPGGPPSIPGEPRPAAIAGRLSIRRGTQGCDSCRRDASPAFACSAGAYCMDNTVSPTARTKIGYTTSHPQPRMLTVRLALSMIFLPILHDCYRFS